MYLSIDQCDKLAGISNRFEVAIRSYVADIIIGQMSEKDFIDNLLIIANSLKVSAHCIPVNTAKYSAKANSLAKPTIYKNLENAKKSYDISDIIPGDVLSVGDLVDVILLFYNPAFISLGAKFDTLEQFVEMLSIYHHNVRNKLFHIATAKINYRDVERTLSLIIAILNQIEDKYFWFSSKTDINKLVSELTNSLNEGMPVLNNLSVVPKKHNQLVLRENEMKELSNLICGDSVVKRVAGSVELHGYGGVGKTALALEFCYEIIRKEMNGNGPGYSFILWLSSKTEELTYQRTIGTVYIRNLEPLYNNCNDVILHLKKLLGQDDSISLEETIAYIANNNLKGLIVLDNLETLDTPEKSQIEGLIRQFPRAVQFLLTSRNYENIAEVNMEIRGFSNLEDGKKFAHEYSKAQGFEDTLDDLKLGYFVKHSFGNTLIMVLGLGRIFDGTSSLETIIGELQVYDGSDIEMIVDFMYKNTFDTAISEIEQEINDLKVRELLTIMLLYDEPVDFHSLRELLDFKDAKDLDLALIKLVSKFVVIKTKGYYELHDFAQKFIVLKILPDELRLREIQTKIHAYKNSLKDSLRQLYEDKQNYSKLKPIIDDWKPATEAETIAIAQSYNEYKRVSEALRNKKSREKIENLLEETKINFSKFELRSNHPYVKFQRARVLNQFRSSFNTHEKIHLDGEIIASFEETHFSINFRHKFISSTESYAAFLWIYGIYLTITHRYPEAVRIIEECVDRLAALKKPRNRLMPAKVQTLLAEGYAQLYLTTRDNRYLNKLRGSIIEAIKINQMIGKPEEDLKKLSLLHLFSEVHLHSFRPRDVSRKIRELRPFPIYLFPFLKSIEEQYYSVTGYKL